MNRLLLLHLFIISTLLSYSQANKMDIFGGIYVKENPPQKKEQPKITCTFTEFSSKEAYEKSKKKIQEYQLYKTAPFAQERTMFVNPSLYFKEIDSLLKKRYNLQSLKYYLDITSVRKEKSEANLYSTLPYETIYQPFYIFNAEVTNWEYRVFVNYVRDSIARTLIAQSDLTIAKDFGEIDEKTQSVKLKWEKKIPYNDNKVTEVLNSLYYPNNERFYYRREIDSRKLNYQYTYYASDSESHRVIINVAPDTLMWLTFKNYWSEPLACMYNWHSSYDQNPVVNITYNQAKAFMIWRTDLLQKYFNSKKILYEVEFDFPTEVELEMMELTTKLNQIKKKNAKNRLYYPQEIHPSIYSLVVNPTSKKADFENNCFYFDKAYLNDLNEACFIKNYNLDNKVYPTVQIGATGLNGESKTYYESLSNSNFLPFLNGNVSEWMKETFSNNDTSIYIDEITNKKNIQTFNIGLKNKFFNYSGNFEIYY